jgi:outer membrane lipoprotein-sorting protein
VGPDKVNDRRSTILASLRTAQEAIIDLAADVTQKKETAIFPHPVVSHGVLLLKKPDKLKIEFEPPNASVTLLTNEVLTIYFPQDNVAQRYEVGKNPSLGRWLLMFRDPVATLGDVLRLEDETEDEVVMSVDPTQDLTMFRSIRLHIEKDNWLLRKLELEEKNGDRTSISYRYTAINSGIPDSRFTLDLPADTDIIQPLQQQ